MTASPASTLTVHAADWQRDLISQAWLYSTSTARAVDELELVVVAINKGQALSTREDTELGDAIYKLKRTVADLVLTLSPATAGRAQEIARTLPRVEGPSVSIEDLTDNAAFRKVMREIYKEAGVSEDFGG